MKKLEKKVIDHILEFLARYSLRSILILASTHDYAVISNYLENAANRGFTINCDVRDRIGTTGAFEHSNISTPVGISLRALVTISDGEAR